jgi:hypothetical protein
VEARAPLRQHLLRPRAARNRRSSPRPRIRHRRSVAGGSSHRRDRLARPWGRLRSRGCPRRPGGDSGRRPTASDGERQPRLPRRGTAVDDPDPPYVWRRHRRPRAADLRGAEQYEGLPRVARRRTLPSERWQTRGCRSSRSSCGRAAADRPSAAFCPANTTMSSASARVRSSPGSSSSTKPGRVAAGTGPNFGVAFDTTASAAACASSPNGPPGGAARRRRRPVPESARPPGKSR